MFKFGSSKITPAIVKIKGSEADVNFLAYCVSELLSGCVLRTRWTLSGRKPVVDINGYNEFELISGNDFEYVNRMAEVVGVKVISIAYGSIPKDDRPRNKAEITYTVTYNGRSAVFDLSTR